VENTLVENNDVAVSFSLSEVQLVNNSIVHNRIGILGPSSGNANIHNNNICDNTGYDLQLRGDDSLNASDNYWCTTLPETIEAHTFDLRDDVGTGFLTYTPFRTEAVPEAPAF
jgi:hypothetical protein